MTSGKSAEPESYIIRLDDGILSDMRARLAHARVAPDFDNDDWRYGANATYLSELARYWASDFDWRAQEKAMNAYNHQRVMIDGIPIHYIHERGRGPNPVPIILSHGWPWTFWDLRKIIGPLTDPAAHGADPSQSFDVIIPSLPGFGFSTPLRTTGVNAWRTADLWHRLMHDILGYPRYAAQGGDFGAAITAQLGHRYARHVMGIHLTVMIPLGYWTGLDGPKPEDYSAEEAQWREKTLHFTQHELAYAQIQATKPQSLAYGLNDSPIGLLAWLLEKRRTWSDCDGDVEKRFSKDDLCTLATIYWATESIGTAARYYYESLNNPWAPDHDRLPVVSVPTAMAIFPKDVFLMPEAWARRYYDVRRWTVMPRGGHFSPAEEPEAVSRDIREFFNDIR